MQGSKNEMLHATMTQRTHSEDTFKQNNLNAVVFFPLSEIFFSAVKGCTISGSRGDFKN